MKFVSKLFDYKKQTIQHLSFPCSLQLITQGLRTKALKINQKVESLAKVAAFGLEAPQEELLEVISEVAVNIHGAFVLKSSPEDPKLRLMCYCSLAMCRLWFLFYLLEADVI